jgi:hypothetical protein
MTFFLGLGFGNTSTSTLAALPEDFELDFFAMVKEI